MGFYRWLYFLRRALMPLGIKSCKEGFKDEGLICMAIEQKGQYYFSLSVVKLEGNHEIVYRDFIEEGNLENFVITEKAGGQLPSYSLTFLSGGDDDGLVQRLNLGSLLECSFGVSGNKQSVLLTILDTSFNPSGSALNKITIKGLLYSGGYLTNPKIRSFKNKSASSVVGEVAGEYFLFNKYILDRIKRKVELLEGDDSIQNWIQPNFTDSRFLSNVWTRCNLPTSFVCVGIDTFGYFIIKDMRKDTNPTINFGPSEQENGFVYESDYSMSSNAGLLSSWVGRGINQIEYEMDRGLEFQNDGKVDITLSSTETLPKSAVEENRILSPLPINQNTNIAYWSAQNRNLYGAAAASISKVSIGIKGVFVDSSVLDVIYFQCTNEVYSGPYWISSIDRILSDRKLLTNISFTKESVNAPRGDF